MPELPEVETIVRDLARVLPGRTIHGIEVLRPDLLDEDPAGFAAALLGRTIRRVDRRAKNIVLVLDRGRMLVNLGMTGRLLVADAAEPDPSHLGVRFRLDDARELRYHDVRRFGRLWRASEPQWRQWEAALGVEPLSDAFTPEWLHEWAGRSRVPIKTWLMDQRRVVGVGNIYASEALFRAAIDPHRPAQTLSPAEAERLNRAIRDVLRAAIEFRGTTLLDYRDARGEQGGFRSRLQVYARAGEPCPTCGAEIQRSVQGGRSTFFCVACQY